MKDSCRAFRSRNWPPSLHSNQGVGPKLASKSRNWPQACIQSRSWPQACIQIKELSPSLHPKSGCWHRYHQTSAPNLCAPVALGSIPPSRTFSEVNKPGCCGPHYTVKTTWSRKYFVYPICHGGIEMGVFFIFSSFYDPIKQIGS